MGDKQIVTTSKATQNLIIYWLLWSILFLGFVYSIAYNLISYTINSLIFSAIIAIILQGVLAYITWKSSIKSTFKKITISKADVNKVMKNLIIFTVCICALNAIYQFYKVNSTIDEEISSNVELIYTENLLSHIYSNEQMADYNKLKEDAIKQAKGQVYVYLIVLEVGLTATYLAILPLEKKEILKYVS